MRFLILNLNFRYLIKNALRFFCPIYVILTQILMSKSKLRLIFVKAKKKDIKKQKTTQMPLNLTFVCTF